MSDCRLINPATTEESVHEEDGVNVNDAHPVLLDEDDLVTQVDIRSK